MKPWQVAVAGALLLQVLLVLTAVFIGILNPEPPEPARFVAGGEGDGQLAEERQAQMADMARMQSAFPTVESLVSESLLAESLPQALGMSGAADLIPGPAEVGMDLSLGGMSGLAGGATLAEDAMKAVKFFGLESHASRIIIAFDISASVKTKVERAGWTMEAIREETKRNLEQLNLNTVFGLIQFARRYESFRDYLAPATVEEKEAAGKWLDTSFRTNGVSGSNWKNAEPNGIEAVLEAAFSLDPQPDLLVIVSDGDFQRSQAGGRGGENVPWKALRETTRKLQAGLDAPCRIQLIGFCVRPDHRGELQQWLRENRGDLLEYGPDRIN